MNTKTARKANLVDRCGADEYMWILAVWTRPENGLDWGKGVMTVGELILKLSEFPTNLEVVLDCEGCRLQDVWTQFNTVWLGQAPRDSTGEGEL